MSGVDEGLRLLRAGNFVGARETLELAAATDPSALFHLALLASNGQGEPQNPTRAADLYRRAAALGVPEAAYNLGALHARGRGVSQSFVEALACYRRAAELGDRDASFKVATMLALGEAGPAVFDEPERRWRELAATGHVPSMLFLGNLYNGLGPQRSAAQAAKWYFDAYREGDDDAAAALDELVPALEREAENGAASAQTHLGGVLLQLREDAAAAVRWFEQAAEQGDPAAQRSLGYLYAEGLGVAQNSARAAELYEAAARRGDPVAQLNLARAYLHGEGVEPDPTRACELLRESAASGEDEAMVELADQLSERGEEAAALAWYLHAALRGNLGAMQAIAHRYRDGVGTPRDLVQSVRWSFAMLALGDGDGLHAAHELAHEMSDSQIREAAGLAGHASFGESLIATRGRFSGPQ